MRSKLPVPRYVLPASVDVGDAIRVTWKDGDLEHSVTGVVGHRHGRTLSTPEGKVLLTYESQEKLKRVTLLSKAEAEQSALFGNEMLEEVSKRL